MIHPEIQNNLLAYIDGALAPNEETALRDHLAACDDCRAELVSMQSFVGRLSASLAESAASVEPSPQAWPAIQQRTARLGRFTPPFQGEFRLSRSLRVFSLALGALAIIAFVGLVIISPLRGFFPASDSTLTPTSDMVEPPADPNATPGPTPTAEVYPFYQLNPTRLPAGLTERIDVLDESSQYSRILFYNKTDYRFLLVDQRPTVYFSSILSGEAIRLGSLDAYANTNIPLSVDVGGQAINAEDARSLSFDTPFGTRVNIFTNLPPQDFSPFVAALVVDRGYFVPRPYPAWTEFHRGQSANVAGMYAREDRIYNASGQFVILTQQSDLIGEALEGEAITINGQNASLVRDQSGTAPAAEGAFLNGVEGLALGASGSAAGSKAPTEPTGIPYTGGLRIEWVRDGIRLNLLTNLSQAEAVAFAEALQWKPLTIGLEAGYGGFVENALDVAGLPEYVIPNGGGGGGGGGGGCPDGIDPAQTVSQYEIGPVDWLNICLYDIPTLDEGAKFTVTLTSPNGRQYSQPYTISHAEEVPTVVPADPGRAMGFIASETPRTPVEIGVTFLAAQEYGTWQVEAVMSTGEQFASGPIEVVADGPIYSVTRIDDPLDPFIVTTYDVFYPGDIVLFAARGLGNTVEEQRVLALYSADPARGTATTNTMIAYYAAQITVAADGTYQVEFVIGPETWVAYFNAVFDPQPGDFLPAPFGLTVGQ